MLDRTFKSPLGRKNELVAYSIFIEKSDIQSRCIFYINNPHQSRYDAVSYKGSIQFKMEQESPKEAFCLWLETFRLLRPDNEIFIGRLSLAKNILEIGILATKIIMQNFHIYILPNVESFRYKGEIHPNGTGCSPGGEVNRCSCGKYCSQL